MIVTPRPYKIPLDQDPTRSAGLHLTDITRDIGFAMGYIPPQYLGAEIDPVRVSLGSAWEAYAFPRLHPEVLHQPGETRLLGNQKNNICGTSDGISILDPSHKFKFEGFTDGGKGVVWYGDVDKRVHEMKLTWKSRRTEQDFEKSWWLLVAQTKSYCFGWETNLATWHIFWVNGYYKRDDPTDGPAYCLYDVEFSARELRENIVMMKNYATTKGWM